MSLLSVAVPMLLSLLLPDGLSGFVVIIGVEMIALLLFVASGMVECLQ